jgi:hypothetical protein
MVGQRSTVTVLDAESVAVVVRVALDESLVAL